MYAIDAKRELIFIDAGGSDDMSRLLANASDGGLAPGRLRHVHRDHAGGLAGLRAAYRTSLPKLAGLDVDALLPGPGVWMLRGGQHIDRALEDFRLLWPPPNVHPRRWIEASSSPNSVLTERLTNARTRCRRQQAMAVRAP